MGSPIRTRLRVVPGGLLHIEAARIALFNWSVARRAGGQFLLRVEDGEPGHMLAGGAGHIFEDLRWLGLDWDEEPWLQDRRTGAYEEHYKSLIESGAAYLAIDTPEELERMRQTALAAWRPFRYVRPARLPDAGEVERARREGRPVVVRLQMPGRDITVDDQVLGPVTIALEELDDFVIRGADGEPTWLFADMIEDERMGITHVIRGQEDLPWAHRQAALREALGFGQPIYAHVPMILDEAGRRLSRDVDVRGLRAEGYLSEAVVAFVAGLGWSAPRGRTRFTREEIARAFDLGQVSRTAARFDREGLLALNETVMAQAGPDRLLAGLADRVSLGAIPLRGVDEGTLRKLLRLATGARTFGEIEQKCGVLFVEDEKVVYDERAVKKVLGRGDPKGFELLRILRGRLAGLNAWDAEHLERLIAEVGLELGLRAARLSQTLRVAVTGGAGNLAIGLMLEVAGRERVLRRMETCVRKMAGAY